jgi:hypothetical protein
LALLYRGFNLNSAACQLRAEWRAHGVGFELRFELRLDLNPGVHHFDWRYPFDRVDKRGNNPQTIIYLKRLQDFRERVALRFKFNLALLENLEFEPIPVKLNCCVMDVSFNLGTLGLVVS